LYKRWRASRPERRTERARTMARVAGISGSSVGRIWRAFSLRL
jgi:hypothetical protein